MKASWLLKWQLSLFPLSEMKLWGFESEAWAHIFKGLLHWEKVCARMWTAELCGKLMSSWAGRRETAHHGGSSCAFSCPAPKALPVVSAATASFLQLRLPATPPLPTPLPFLMEKQYQPLYLFPDQQGNTKRGNQGNEQDGLSWVFSEQWHKKTITRIFKPKVLVHGGGGGLEISIFYHWYRCIYTNVKMNTVINTINMCIEHNLHM